MYYLFVCLSTCVFCIGLIVFLKRPFLLLSTSAVRQLDTILNTSLQESEKDLLLLRNLKKLITHLLVVFSFLILVVIVSLVPVYLFITIKPVEDIDLHSVYFYLSMIIGSSVLFFFKSKSSDYSYWSKLLHTIVLDNYALAKYLFRNEKKRSLKKDHPPVNKEFVIVTGLARAGTTALTNLLFDPRQFHSISYANMPFLMAPGLWRKVYNPKEKKAKERAHGDKVLFSENSIEALEEYFFKVFLNDEYITEDAVNVHQIDENVYQSYLQYQQFFKNPQLNTLYLAKNNNFIQRYLALRDCNQDFKVVMIFRSPIAHASSLQRQHNNFTIQQSDDPFVKTYMNWLGHYEFGLNQKVFDFGEPKLWENHKKDTLNYWIEIWINYYQYVLSLPQDDKLYLIDYEDLLKSPEKLKAKLGEILDVHLIIEDQNKFEPPNIRQKKLPVDNQILTRADRIFDELVKKKIKIVE